MTSRKRAPLARKLVDGAGDVVKTQMHQAVPAQNHVGGGSASRVMSATRNRPDEFAARDAPVVGRDQRRHDVDAGVVEIELDAADPAGIAARRIEQRARAEPLQQSRKRVPDRSGRRILRAEARHRTGGAPEVRPLDPLEPRGKIEAREIIAIGDEPLMGKHGWTIGDHRMSRELDVRHGHTVQAMRLGRNCPQANPLASTIQCLPMRPTTANEKAKMVAGAVTAVIMTAVLFVVALAFLMQ